MALPTPSSPKAISSEVGIVSDLLQSKKKLCQVGGHTYLRHPDMTTSKLCFFRAGYLRGNRENLKAGPQKRNIKEQLSGYFILINRKVGQD